MSTYNYINNLQPTIVKAVDNTLIPEDLRGQYMLSLVVPVVASDVNNVDLYNVQYIIYTSEETGELISLVDTDTDQSLTTNAEYVGTSSFTLTLSDVPRVYIRLTEELVNDQSALTKWYFHVLHNLEYLIYGYGTFVPGESYYINYTLYGYLLSSISEFNNAVEDDLSTSYTLPNLLDSNFLYTEYWEDIDAQALSRNVEYFYSVNVNESLDVDVSDLSSILGTVCELLLSDDENGIITLDDNIKIALKYYLNGGYDDVSIALGKVLGSSTVTTNTSTSSCGCSSNQLDTSSTNTSCASLYTDALKELIINAWGTKEWYSSVFYTTDELGECVVNEALVEALRSICNALLEYTGYITTISVSCGLVSVDDLVSDDAANRTIISNFVTALGYISDNTLYAHVNYVVRTGTKFITLLLALFEV